MSEKNVFASMIAAGTPGSRSESPLVDIPLPPAPGQMTDIEEVDIGIFLLSRPWSGCPRCMREFEEEGAAMFGGENVYVCPHTQLKEYKALLNKLRDRNKFFVYERRIETLKDGSIQGHLEWCVMKETKQKEGAGTKTPRL